MLFSTFTLSDIPVGICKAKDSLSWFVHNKCVLCLLCRKGTGTALTEVGSKISIHPHFKGDDIDPSVVQLSAAAKFAQLFPESEVPTNLVSAKIYTKLLECKTAWLYPSLGIQLGHPNLPRYCHLVNPSVHLVFLRSGWKRSEVWPQWYYANKLLYFSDSDTQTGVVAANEWWQAYVFYYYRCVGWIIWRGLIQDRPRDCCWALSGRYHLTIRTALLDSGTVPSYLIWNGIILTHSFI